ncbi:MULTISPECIES: hypothetical protein [unclassified Mesorhizobium]|uniref:hypothetical protein n=1 Tax=unclassified Mesorhizobium TaxID=325217 RepID=UPI001CD0136E|nr:MULTISPECIES: hypothetical protein [unclassified Mesorhizobium]MBZ9810888.1 hypothetical protein [Mesorhizobium sp. ESP-6-2]
MTVLDPHRGEMGHIVLTVLGMVVQMERRFIKSGRGMALKSGALLRDVAINLA